MKKFLILLLALSFLLPCNLISQEPESEAASEEEAPLTIDERISAAMAPVNQKIGSIVFFTVPVAKARDAETGEIIVDPETNQTEYVQVPFVLIWLVVAAIFFTIYFKFANLRHFKLAIDIVRGKHDDPESKGEVSHFKALATALSATVGLGNIAGVAVAISVGGPGATFWMIVAGLLGMSTKFVECTLGVKYRTVDERGKVFGGPMYYLSKGFAERGTTMGAIGKVLAIFFAFMCIGGTLGGGNIFQINQAVEQIVNVTGGTGSLIDSNRWFVGLVMAVVVGMVIIGGIVSIARVTARVVPFMCALYVIAAIIILLANFSQIPAAFGAILSGAFSPVAVSGGIIGVLIQGFKRAAFSNEAGIGSAPIAHAAVKTDHPATEGIVALLEPFIDTVIVCTMTALVIVITGNTDSSLSGVQLTSNAFASVISWFPLVLSVAVILFAFSTMISWAYYGQQAWDYLFGRGKVSEMTFKFIYCLFVILGASMSLEQVVGLSDAMIFAMCFPNIIGLYLLAPKVKVELNSYLEELKTNPRN